MTRWKTQRNATVDNVFTQSQSNVDNTVFGLRLANGIKVQGACHSTDQRIETVVKPYADDFLKHDGHFFLIDQVACSRHISLTVAIKHRRINPFDGIAHRPQHLVFIVHIRHHIRRIDTCERLIMGIFEQTRRTNRDRALHHFEESHQIVDQPLRKFGLQETAKHLLVADINQCQWIQTVRFHKLIEDIGAENDRFRDVDRKVLLIQHRIAFDHRTDKSQSPPFTSEWSLADTCKITVLVKPFFLINSHNPGVLHLPILYDDIENKLPCIIQVRAHVHINLFQQFSRRKHRAWIEETRKVIARKMIPERAFRNIKNLML